MPSVVWPWGVGVLSDPNTPSSMPVSQPNTPDSLFGFTLTSTVSKDNPVPLAINAPAPFEFSLSDFIPTSVSKATTNAARLLASSTTPAVQQSQTPAWYDVFGRMSAAASGVNDALQSTLIKIIVLLVIASTAYLIFISKVTKAANA